MKSSTRNWSGYPLLLALTVAAPTSAWAQVNYETLTLIDAAYLQIGLDIQHIIRNMSSFSQLPAAVTISCVLYLLVRRLTSANPQPLAHVVMYFITSMLICTLFWPESIGGLVTRTGGTVSVTPDRITSQIARNEANQSAQHDESADDVGIRLFMQQQLQNLATRVPTAYHLILDAVIGIPLVLGNTLNGNLNRPYERPMAAEHLLTMQIPDSAAEGLYHLRAVCLGPGLDIVATSAAGDDGLQWEEMLPHTGPLYNAFDHVKAVAAIRNVNGMPDPWPTAVTQIDNPDGSKDRYITCKSMVDVVIRPTLTARLNTLQTEGGQPLGTAVETATGMPIADQVSLLIYRAVNAEIQAELEHDNRPLVESENYDRLANRMLTAGALSAAISIANATKGPGGFFGAIAEFFSGGLSTSLHSVMAFMRPALVLLFFMPYITGMLTACVVGLFPIVLLWSLFPNQHFKPLINYFLVLVFCQSAPIWYAVADILATAAFQRYGGHVGVNYWQNNGIGEFFEGQAAGLFVAVVATYLVPAIQALLLFGTWRAIGSAMRGV